jgi:phosphoribosyl 1,2-cyclic phosphodiesterase
MIIAPLCSSSAANSTFIGSHDKTEGVLVDIGCSYKALRGYLSDFEIELSAVKAVLITHEHTDHVNGLRVFMKNNDIPVFASAGTCDALLEKGLVHSSHKRDRLFDFSEISVLGLDCDIKAFHTPHDSAQSVGFSITCSNGKRIAYMTDLGEITDEVREATLGADGVLIESNYDSELLWNNKKYPYHTKERIDSRRGHLSNCDSADYILRLIESGATQVMLGHLSRENNTPNLALANTIKRLETSGLRQGHDYTLDVAGIQTNGEYIAV